MCVCMCVSVCVCMCMCVCVCVHVCVHVCVRARAKRKVGLSLKKTSTVDLDTQRQPGREECLFHCIYCALLYMHCYHTEINFKRFFKQV